MENGKLTRIVVTVVLCILLFLSFVNYLDKQSAKQHDKIMGRALVTFGLVKTLNATISAAQATEVNVSPAGLGVTLGLGEALDPLNDFIERFSWIMIVSATSLGIQKLVMEIGGLKFVNIVLATTIVCFLIIVFNTHPTMSQLEKVLMENFFLLKILWLSWGGKLDPPNTHQVGLLGDVLKSTYSLDILTLFARVETQYDWFARNFD